MRTLIISLLCLISFNAQADSLTLTAKDFANQEKMPVIFTCDDKDISPAIEWSGVPTKAKSLALIVSDIDAPSGTFYHWIVYNIPPTANNFTEDMKTFPDGVLFGRNSWNHTHYDGPCPPKNVLHHYIFTLYALDTTLNIPADSDAITVLNALQNHVLEVTKLTATYSH